MKYLIGIIVVLVLAGGAYYYYRAQNITPEDGATMEDRDVTTDDDAMTDSNSTTKDEGSMTEETGDVKVFTVTGKSFSFSPSTITVKNGDTVRIVFKNTEGFHDFALDEFNVKTKQINDGQEEIVEFVANKVGQFEYYCSVGQHRQMGMMGTLTVTE